MSLTSYRFKYKSSLEVTFRRSAAMSLSATSSRLPKSLSDAIRTGFTTTPMVLPRVAGSSNRSVAPAFSTCINPKALHQCTSTQSFIGHLPTFNYRSFFTNHIITHDVNTPPPINWAPVVFEFIKNQPIFPIVFLGIVKTANWSVISVDLMRQTEKSCMQQ